MNDISFSIAYISTSCGSFLLKGETNSGNEVVSDPRYFFHAIYNTVYLFCYGVIKLSKLSTSKQIKSWLLNTNVSMLRISYCISGHVIE